jgi:hypothetical protein
VGAPGGNKGRGLDDHRESKKRLQEAVRQWAEWHGRHYVTVGSSLDRERDREKPSFQDIEHACYL